MDRSGSSWTREEALDSYLKAEHEIEEVTPSMLYSTVVSTAVSRVASQLGTTLSDEEKEAAGASVGKWTPWPDTVAALKRLSKYYKLVILSNVDLASFSHTKKLLEHGFIFDKILTAQEIGSYKPNTTNFLYMLNVAKEEFGVEKEQVLVTAQSLMHDHVPANKLGLASSYIQREEGRGNAEGAEWTFAFPTLEAMADALESELAKK
jgi:2-haloalkanoic acid dehalogenase type II